MADEFGIDPTGFSLNGPDSWDPYSTSGTDYLGSIGYDQGGSSFGSGLNLGVPSLYSDNPFQMSEGFGAPSPSAGIFSNLFGSQAGASPASTAAGVGLPLLGTATGLAGIIQQMAMGRPQQQIRSNVQQSPQQAQLTAQTMAALQNLQGQAQNQQLQQAISSLLQGNLPITPNLVDQVTKAFGGSMSGLMKSTAENARQRGWQGTEGDAAFGAGSPVFSQGINDIENQVNQALVNLALGIPQAAANMQGSLVNQQMAPIQGMEGLLGQMNQFAGLNRNTDILNPKQNNFLGALPAISQLSLGLGQMGANRSMMQQPQYGQQQPNLSGVYGG